MTPFEQGWALGNRIAAEHPLPADLADRLAVLLRPAAEHSRRSCARTGSPTSACMAAPDGGCGYCGVPAAEAWARAEALDDERAQLIVEGLT